MVMGEWMASRTSRRVTGFSSRDRCVSLVKFLSTSRSASSAKLFEVRIKVRRFGIEFGRVGWMLFTRLRARRRVWSLGESGKFPSTLISLSVKSIASWSYQRVYPVNGLRMRTRGLSRKALTRATARFSICGILWPFYDINGARSSAVLFFSAFTHLWDRAHVLWEDSGMTVSFGWVRPLTSWRVCCCSPNFLFCKIDANFKKWWQSLKAMIKERVNIVGQAGKKGCGRDSGVLDDNWRPLVWKSRAYFLNTKLQSDWGDLSFSMTCISSYLMIDILSGLFRKLFYDPIYFHTIRPRSELMWPFINFVEQMAQVGKIHYALIY